MATVTCGSGTALDMDSFNPISVSDYAQYTLIPTELRLFNNAQNYTSITGVNFAFNVITQEVTGGTVHGLKVVSNGAISFQVTGANASAVTLYSLGLANDALGIYSLLLGGNDAFTGGADLRDHQAGRG